MLNESPTVLHRLVRVLSSSPFLAGFLCREPQFLDLVLRDEFLEEVRTTDDYLEEFQGGLQDSEDPVQTLREIQQLELFRIQLRDILEANDRPSVGAQLAGLAETSLKAACEIACRQLKQQEDVGLADWVAEHLIILSLGKLGGADLSYNSDLDLVYFYAVEPQEQPDEVQRRASRVVERIAEILSVSRGEGSIYQIDTRLKPEGRKGGVVAPLHRYEEYLKNRAEPWERLALARHRVVFGSPENLRRFEQIVQPYLYGQGLSVKTVREIRHIRRRMETELGREQEENRFHIKAGCGGLTDIEFCVQLLQLRHGERLRELQAPNTLTALSTLVRHNLLAVPDYYVLYMGYEFLRFVENRLRMVSSHSTAWVTRTPQQLGRIGRLLGDSTIDNQQGAETFETTYLEATRQVREVFDRNVSELEQ